jgi:hypothetical protein
MTFSPRRSPTVINTLQVEFSTFGNLRCRDMFGIRISCQDHIIYMNSFNSEFPLIHIRKDPSKDMRPIGMKAATKNILFSIPTYFISMCYRHWRHCPRVLSLSRCHCGVWRTGDLDSTVYHSYTVCDLEILNPRSLWFQVQLKKDLKVFKACSWSPRLTERTTRDIRKGNQTLLW